MFHRQVSKQSDWIELYLNYGYKVQPQNIDFYLPFPHEGVDTLGDSVNSSMI